jgi:hypothetical protein
MRIIVAAIVGGLIVFFWSAVAHMATPLGTMGMSSIANEDPVIEAMRSNITHSGLYVFPAITPDGKMSPAQEAKMRRGPTGLIAYTAGGMDGVSPHNLILELTTNILAALIAAFIISMIAGTLVRRALIVALLALFATISLTMSYWIWYGFPLPFVLAELATEIVGWFLAGLAMAKIMAPRAAAV